MFTSEFLDLPPLKEVSGTVVLPGSKSISNRVLLLAGLSAGETRVHDLLDSDDTRVMLDALKKLGCVITPEGSVLRVRGVGGQPQVSEAHLFLGNAGTAMRPLTAALAVLSATRGGVFELSGVPRMHERPIGDLINALRPLGCQVECLGQEGYPPLRLSGGRLKLDEPIRVRGDVSSQFLTALLLALPLVATHQSISIEVQGELISKPYIEITLKLLEKFGVMVQRDGWSRFVIPAGSKLQSPQDIHVEGDASSASYFIGLGAMAATGQPLRVEGVGHASIQGDIRFVEAAQAMGAEVTSGANWLEIRRGSWPLKAIDLDCNHIPDAAMTLAVMALYAEGTTRLRNIASWRVKETDRIAAMAAELRKVGAHVVEGDDFIEVTPPARPSDWKAARIRTYDDHRVAMCFSLAAFNPLVGADVPIRILDPKCVAKTFPDYFETLFDVVHLDKVNVPVITIDGPTASGKGTLANQVAQHLGYHLLDSGALYRATALAAQDAGVALDDEDQLAHLAADLPLTFKGHQVFLAGHEITDPLRQESTGGMASMVSQYAKVREALHQLQLSFRRLPGLVADGRDMGTVIFPEAQLKVFLTASAETRAERRYKQLIDKGIPAKLDSLVDDIKERDSRDQSRKTAPLVPAKDAKLLDNSMLSVAASTEQVLSWWEQSHQWE